MELARFGQVCCICIRNDRTNQCGVNDYRRNHLTASGTAFGRFGLSTFFKIIPAWIPPSSQQPWMVMLFRANSFHETREQAMIVLCTCASAISRRVYACIFLTRHYATRCKLCFVVKRDRSFHWIFALDIAKLAWLRAHVSTVVSGELQAIFHSVDNFFVPWESY